MSETSLLEQTENALQLKGGMYTLLTLKILNADLLAFEVQLKDKIQQAPNFFNNAPVILDFQNFNKSFGYDFEKLKQILINNKLIPVGVKGANANQNQQAIKHQLAIIKDDSKVKTETLEEPLEKNLDDKSINERPQTIIKISNKAKIITEPVRSGQQIYAQGSDLIIMASVSQGAELLADGNIHVYGTLRGRALAGITGDVNARIFCDSLEAELISIAGQYKLSEDIEKDAWKIRASIYLKDSHLHINEI